jgi:hypothetical protein
MHTLKIRTAMNQSGYPRVEACHNVKVLFGGFFFADRSFPNTDGHFAFVKRL